MSLLHEDLTKKIIGCFYNVYNELGYGFLEKVYENALKIELEKAGLKVETQKKIEVYYKSEKVGHYVADLVVNDSVILELKATPIIEAHILQLFNYLKATDIEVGLLLSFGEKPVFIRKVFSNERKKNQFDNK
jgi:GxxExxY protein